MTAPNVTSETPAPALNTPNPQSNSELEELRRTNAQILQQNAQIMNLLMQNQSRPAAPAPEPVIEIPKISGQEFLDAPIDHIDRVVTARAQKIAQDLNNQLAPVNNFILQQQRHQQIQNIVAQMKMSGGYQHLNIPAVEQVFVATLSAANNIDQNVIAIAYNAAVGSAVSSGAFQQPTQVTVPNNPPAPQVPNIPAHLQPTSRAPQDNSITTLPPLDENQSRIAKERGWSHAKAAYMYDKITFEQYKKIDPNAKEKY